jgi:CDP-diglyceride synthetase
VPAYFTSAFLFGPLSLLYPHAFPPFWRSFGHPSLRPLPTKDVAGAVLGAFAGAPLLFMLAVLLGAPASASRTGIWAAMQAAVTAVPLGIAAARDAAGRLAGGGASSGAEPSSILTPAWLSAFAAAPFHRNFSSRYGSVIAPAWAGLAGSWFGACTSLLDWDEAWQPWPISSALGCGAGVAAAWAGVAAAAAFRRACGRSHERHKTKL